MAIKRVRIDHYHLDGEITSDAVTISQYEGKCIIHIDESKSNSAACCVDFEDLARAWEAVRS